MRLSVASWPNLFPSAGYLEFGCPVLQSEYPVRLSGNICKNWFRSVYMSLELVFLLVKRHAG